MPSAREERMKSNSYANPLLVDEDLGGSVLSALGLHVLLDIVVNRDIAGLVGDLLALEDHLDLGLLLLDLSKRRRKKDVRD